MYQDQLFIHLLPLPLPLCGPPDESRPVVDEVSMLTAITLFLLSASSELLGVTALQKGCMDRFRNALNSSDPWV